MRSIQEGKEANLLAICTDISQVKRIEKQQQLMRTNFFSTVAHELRTPLNTVLPILKLVLEQLPRDTPGLLKMHKYLKIVYNSSIHLQNVIEDALDVARIENGKFQLFKEWFDLRKAITEVADIMEF